MRTHATSAITWHDVPKVLESELRTLQLQYGFHDLDIEDCLSEHERPKIEEYEHYLFFVFHLPVLSKGRVVKEEVNIFLGQQYLITIHNGNLDVLEAFWEEVSQGAGEELFQRGPSFLLQELMERLFDAGFPIVDRIRRSLNEIEQDLFEHEEEVDVLRDIMKLKRNIITIRSILQPQRTLIALLEHKNRKFIPEELGIYFDDILDAIERQWTLLEIAKEMCEALHDTHESWLTHETNSVVRILTIMSVTLLPGTLISGIFGMNVPLPYQNNPFAFLGIILGMMGILMATLAYFVWKKWL